MQMPKPTTMPKPTDSMSFGDLRKPPVTMPKSVVRHENERVLKPDAKPIPDIQTYRQTNGTFYLVRWKYGKIWISHVSESETQAIYDAEQFYMSETKQGMLDSVGKTQ